MPGANPGLSILNRSSLGGAPRPRHNRVMQRRLAALALTAGLVLASLGWAPSLAAQDDVRLDGLFVRLRVTKDGAEGDRLGREIADIWRQSGREEIDFLMREGERLLAERRMHVALEHFLIVNAMAPEFAEGWNKRAHVNFLLGDYAEAVEQIENTLSLEPRHFLALAGLGLIYLRLGEERLALRSFERALEINPHLSGTRETAQELARKLKDKRT